jgi:hypothetical protein
MYIIVKFHFKKEFFFPVVGLALWFLDKMNVATQAAKG